MSQLTTDEERLKRLDLMEARQRSWFQWREDRNYEELQTRLAEIKRHEDSLRPVTRD